MSTHTRMKSTSAKAGIIGVAVFATAFIAGISCQTSAPPPPAPSPSLPEATAPGTLPSSPPAIEVVMENFSFTPAVLTVPVGSTVTWYNKDSVSHTATARDNSFDSGGLARDGTFSYTFEQRGTFEYYCKPHPYMKGRVIVE